MHYHDGPNIFSKNVIDASIIPYECTHSSLNINSHYICDKKTKGLTSISNLRLKIKSSANLFSLYYDKCFDELSPFGAVHIPYVYGQHSCVPAVWKNRLAKHSSFSERTICMAKSLFWPHMVREGLGQNFHNWL